MLASRDTQSVARGSVLKRLMMAPRRGAPYQRSPYAVSLGVCIALLLGASWWQGVATYESASPVVAAGDAGSAARCAAALWGGPNASQVALAASLDDGAAAAWRSCSEAAYRERDATLVFVHVHKGGGTTFVGMARGNRAGLAAVERNGDPSVGGARVEWWALPPRRQSRWFAKLRERDGVRFVSTEKGFPRSPTHLLAPKKLVYAIVVREPARRFVSYYFWKWRDASYAAVARARLRAAFPALLGAGREVARLRPGAPTFAAFVGSESPLDGYYVRRLLGVPPEEAASFPLDAAALADATAVLRRVFSLVLVTERLADLAPVVAAALGWDRPDFAAFHAKSNPAPDVAKLVAWRDDWREEIGRRMPLDVQFYAVADDLCRRRLDDVARTTTTRARG